MPWSHRYALGCFAIGCTTLFLSLASTRSALAQSSYDEPRFGQSSSDVFGDTRLPPFAEDDADLELPEEEELPPALEEDNGPPIDGQLDGSDFDSPPTEAPRAGVRPDSLSTPRAPDRRSGDGSTNPLNFAPSDSYDDAEIVPQETIRERYPDGSVRVERGVAQDENENYVNHGPWRMWDEDGNLIAEGSYRLGERHGKWMRWYRPDDVELFRAPPFSLFAPPYLSTAEFVDGELQGHWLVTDQNEAKICDWEFESGRRHGSSVWYYHTGRAMRSIQYRHGQIHGELVEWDAAGKQVTRVEYQDGRRLEKTVDLYADGQKKVEGVVLQARLVMKEPDDWWDAKLATYTRQGKDQKHGTWTAWYPSGQMKFSGEYEYDEPSGEFTWWHENGQKSLQALYREGNKTGSWTWWHPNGQKAIQGEYLANSPSGRWVWWQDTGKVAQRIDFSQAAETIVNSPSMMTESESIMLQQPQNRGAMRDRR